MVKSEVWFIHKYAQKIVMDARQVSTYMGASKCWIQFSHSLFRQYRRNDDVSMDFLLLSILRMILVILLQG